MKDRPSPIRPTDDAARALALDLCQNARFGALAFRTPATGHPGVARVAVGWQAGPVTLISDLSHHTQALRADPSAALLLGEPGEKGDPLTHPRLSLTLTARFIDQTSARHRTLRAFWLDRHPKARLYIDFADFRFVAFDVIGADLNGGFGKAFTLTPGDLGLANTGGETT